MRRSRWLRAAMVAAVADSIRAVSPVRRAGNSAHPEQPGSQSRSGHHPISLQLEALTARLAYVTPRVRARPTPMVRRRLDAPRAPWVVGTPPEYVATLVTHDVAS